MSRRKSFNEVQLLNPLATPDWRSRRVNELLADKNNSNIRCSSYDDKWTRRLLTFTKAWRNRGQHTKQVYDQLFQSDPDLSVAFALRNAAIKTPHITIAIEARLLANQSFEQIGEMAGASPEAIEWYERCWFSVRDRLKQYDWVMNQIIIPTYQKSSEIVSDGVVSYYVGIARPFINAGIKLLAYRGGPVVCDYLLQGYSGESGEKPGSFKEAQYFVAEDAISTITRRAAIAAEEVILHADNITEMFNVFARIIAVQRQADKNGNSGGPDNKILKAMHSVVTQTAQQWFSPNVDKQQLAQSELYRYDGNSEELRSIELDLIAHGMDAPELDVMPDREAKPLLRPDQLRDRMAGAVMMALIPGDAKGAKSDPN